MDAVFRNTPIALYFSFEIEGASGKTGASSLRYALIQCLESVKSLNARQREWLSRLYVAQQNPDMNFSGLDFVEVHAQCTMIRQACAQRLRAGERFAVYCQYAKGQQKLLGIKGVASILHKHHPAQSRFVFANLVARHYAGRGQLQELTYDVIAARTRVSRTTLHRLSSIVASTCCELETAAVARLDPIFLAAGVVAEGCYPLDEVENVT